MLEAISNEALEVQRDGDHLVVWLDQRGSSANTMTADYFAGLDGLLRHVEFETTLRGIVLAS